MSAFADFDLSGFWKDSDYARQVYVSEPPTDVLIASIERELGYRLPVSYVELMRTQNGGVPRKTCFPTEVATIWADDHVAISGIFGIGRDKRYSLCGAAGSQFMLEEWGYPDIGICVCNTPSAGHEMIMLDYRNCGPRGEPRVVHVAQESDYEITFLADDFESFIRGLVDENVYDTPADDLARALDKVDNGTLSPLLAGLVSQFCELDLEPILRAACRRLTKDKGYFALHADEPSYFVYDLQFMLYAESNDIASDQQYLDVYPAMIAMADESFSTGGYAPGFVASWLEKRRSAQQIVAGPDGTLQLTESYRRNLIERARALLREEAP